MTSLSFNRYESCSRKWYEWSAAYTFSLPLPRYQLGLRRSVPSEKTPYQSAFPVPCAVHSSKQRICSLNLDWTACSSSSVFTDLLKLAFSQNFISSATELLDMITLIVAMSSYSGQWKNQIHTKKYFWRPTSFCSHEIRCSQKNWIR